MVWATIVRISTQPELEKVVNCPQAENSDLCNVLKIARFATKGEEKHLY